MNIVLMQNQFIYLYVSTSNSHEEIVFGLDWL